jgi:MazG family protein
MAELISVVARLRDPGGCPWDREQTPRTIRPFIIEEAHEVVEAIDSGDPDHLREELGDVLFHILLLAKMGEETGDFSLVDVAKGIAQKLVRRHPHVFGGGTAKDSADVERTWERIKAGEKGHRKSVGDGIPRTVPALTRARRIGERAARTGFDWAGVRGILDKLEEEIGELKAEIPSEGRPTTRQLASAEARLEHELGDVLFVLTNLARHLRVDPERALDACSKRFSGRFDAMRKIIESSGRQIGDLTISEMDAVWEEVKKGKI